MAQTTSQSAQTWSPSLGQEIPPPRGASRSRRRVFPKTVQLPYRASMVWINQRPGAWDRQVGDPQVHPEDPAVLWSLLSDSPISRPERSQGVPPRGCILHWVISAPGGPQTSLQLGQISEGTGERSGAHSTLRPSTARAADLDMFHEGWPFERHD